MSQISFPLKTEELEKFEQVGMLMLHKFSPQAAHLVALISKLDA